MKKIIALLLIVLSINSFAQTTGELNRIIGSISSRIIAQPTSQSLAATGSIQWTVQGGAFYYLTITQAPGATSAFSATIQFETSADGSSYSSVSGNPVIGLPGSGQAAASSTTAAGLWIVQVPPTHQFIRARVSAYTSGTVWAYLEPQGPSNNTIMMPWTPTVTSGQTLSGWLNTSGISEFTVHVSAVTTTVVTAQGTNDPSGTSVQSIQVIQDNSANQAVANTFNTAGSYSIVNPVHKWVRFQVTGTGTVLTVQGATISFGDNFRLSSGQSTVGLNAASVTIGSGTVTTVSTLTGGGIANSAATSANPVTTGGRIVPTTIATADATLVAGDAAYVPITTGQQVAFKPYATAELDYQTNFSSISTTTTVQPLVPASGTASIRNYITAITLSSDALGAAGLGWVLDGSLTVSSIATGTGLVTTSAAHDLKVGDAVVFTALAAGTGVTTNTVYYVTSVGSTTTFNFAATIGGSNVVPSVAYTGTTMYRVLHQFRFQTTAIGSPAFIRFPNPLRGNTNTALNFLFPSSLTSGTVYLSVNGYRGF